jgi:hypothetical protein
MPLASDVSAGSIYATVSDAPVAPSLGFELTRRAVGGVAHRAVDPRAAAAPSERIGRNRGMLVGALAVPVPRRTKAPSGADRDALALPDR